MNDYPNVTTNEESLIDEDDDVNNVQEDDAIEVSEGQIVISDEEYELEVLDKYRDVYEYIKREQKHIEASNQTEDFEKVKKEVLTESPSEVATEEKLTDCKGKINLDFPKKPITVKGVMPACIPPWNELRIP